MATVCLVRPLLSPTDFNGYPLNLLILASALRSSGHTVTIRDYDYLKEVDKSWVGEDFAARAAADILEQNPSFVAISSLCSNYVLAIDLANELKAACNDIHIIFGGPHVSLCALETLQNFPCVDTAVIGEGEVTLPELINCVESIQDLSVVLGIAFRQNGVPIMTAARPLLADLNLSPRPAYDLLDMGAYLKVTKNNYLEVYAGSGCPFACTFCSTSIVWQRKYRTMSASRIVSEIEELYHEYGARSFNLIHDNLTSNKAFIHEISSQIKQRQLQIRWGFSSRIDTLDLETAKIAAESGCDYIFFGIESGSSKIQKTMKKRLKLQAIHDTFNYCIQAGIQPTTSFILGFPDEQMEDISSTIQLAFKCRVGGARRSFINLLSPYTGTPVMTDNKQSLIFDMESVNSTMMSFLYQKHFDIIRKNSVIFANYYSIKYDDSPLSAKDYLGLVDFYTICLFKYPFTVSFLLNDINVDPFVLFKAFRKRIEGMNTEERNALALEIAESDLCSYVTADNVYSLASVLCLDRSIQLTSSSKSGVIYSGNVCLTSRRLLGGFDQPITGQLSKNYLHTIRDQTIVSVEITLEQSLLYQARGLPVIHADQSVQNLTCTSIPA